MRDRIIALLDFPRQWVTERTELETCIYNGGYRLADHICQCCNNEFKCRWLYNTCESAELQMQPVQQLLACLDSALWLVDTQRDSATHHMQCNCEICAWRRQAEKLVSEAEATYQTHPSVPASL